MLDTTKLTQDTQILQETTISLVNGINTLMNAFVDLKTEISAGGDAQQAIDTADQTVASVQATMTDVLGKINSQLSGSDTTSSGTSS